MKKIRLKRATKKLPDGLRVAHCCAICVYSQQLEKNNAMELECTFHDLIHVRAYMLCYDFDGGPSDEEEDA